MNTTEKKQTHRYIGQTSGYQWVGKGTIGIGKWWIQTIRFKLGYKNVFVVYREYSQHFVITNWSITLNL